jgi:hypothetical protein
MKAFLFSLGRFLSVMKIIRWNFFVK